MFRFLALVRADLALAGVGYSLVEYETEMTTDAERKECFRS